MTKYNVTESNNMSDTDKYAKYAKPQNGYLKDLVDFMSRQGIIGVIGYSVTWFIIVTVCWLIVQNRPVLDEYDGTFSYRDQPPYFTKLRNTYWPFDYQNSQIVFKPKSEWWCMVAFVAIMSLLPISYAPVTVFFRRKKNHKQAQNSIATMIDIEKMMAAEHKFDDATKEKLMSVAPHILKNMSADNRVYFDMIMNGKASVQDKKFLKAAAMVMAGHLQSHPEDLQRVKEIFDNEKSMPKDLVIECKNAQKLLGDRAQYTK